MADDIGQESAVPRYRDAAKALYELRRDSAATWIEIADAHGWRPDLRQPKRRAQAALQAARRYAKANGLPWPLPSKPLPSRAASVGKRPYELRRDGAATWPKIAGALGWRPDLPRPARARRAADAARGYAKAHGLPWPLPDRAASERRARAASERMARRDERGLAQVREMVEEERRVLALVEELPKDRTITEPEAERFLVELCRIGMKLSHIAKRTNCSHGYVTDVVRRRAPELMESIRPGAPRGKKRPQAAPLLDLRELRNIWRSEERLRQINRPDAPMFAAWLSGE